MCITMTSYWVRWRLKSPASRLIIQPFVQAQIKENIGHRWIPLAKARHGKCFHLMTSSCAHLLAEFMGYVLLYMLGILLVTRYSTSPSLVTVVCCAIAYITPKNHLKCKSRESRLSITPFSAAQSFGNLAPNSAIYETDYACELGVMGEIFARF